MPSLVRIYRLKEFIRINETGIIDVERSKELIRQLALVAAFRADDSILIDMRDTTIVNASMSGMLEIAAEFALYQSAFRGKIANVIPDDEDRISLARRFKDLLHLDIDPSRYEIFTSFEDAIDWLSKIEEVGEGSGRSPK